MRTAASRLPKGFSLEERLAACASDVEPHPKDRAGQWRCWASPWANGAATPMPLLCSIWVAARANIRSNAPLRAPMCCLSGLDARRCMCDARGRTRHCARRVERRVRAARRLRFVGNVWRGRTFRNAAEFPHAVSEKEEGALSARAFRATDVVSSAVGAGRIRSVAHRQHAAARFLAHSARDRGL